MDNEYKVIPMADMAKAMLDGHTIEFEDGSIAQWDGEIPVRFLLGWVGRETLQGVNQELGGYWTNPCRILPKTTAPTARYMTRDEVIGFIANTPGIMARMVKFTEWTFATSLSFNGDIEDYEYTTVTLDGVYGEPMEFRKEVV